MKSVIGLTGQHLYLQSPQCKTPGQVIQKLAGCRKVRGEKLADNREPEVVIALASPLPSPSQELNIKTKGNPAKQGSTSNSHRTDSADTNRTYSSN